MANKTYVGNGWKSKFGVRISLKIEKLKELPVNKWGDILLEVTERKEPDEKSKATHYVTVDDYAYQKLNGDAPTTAKPHVDDVAPPF